MVKTADEMTSWVNLSMIAAGGAVGSVLRYLLTLAATSVPGGSGALGTTCCNLLGCAAIGAFSQCMLNSPTLTETSQLAIRVGLLGGLTTFSSFALESFLIAENGRWGLSALYVSANLVLGWACVFGTMALVRNWNG